MVPVCAFNRIKVKLLWTLCLFLHITAKALWSDRRRDTCQKKCLYNNVNSLEDLGTVAIMKVCEKKPVAAYSKVI